MADAKEHAEIMRRVAARALIEARAAWKKAQEKPTEKNVRTAYRASLLAARTIRKAIVVNPDHAPQMIDDMNKAEKTRDALLQQLAAIASK